MSEEGKRKSRELAQADKGAARAVAVETAMPPLLTGEQVADLLQIRPGAVARLGRSGRLATLRLPGKAVRYPRASVLALIGDTERPTLDDAPDQIPIIDAAAIAGRSVRTIRRWEALGVVRATRPRGPGTAVYIDRKSLRAALEAEDAT